MGEIVQKNNETKVEQKNIIFQCKSFIFTVSLLLVTLKCYYQFSYNSFHLVNYYKKKLRNMLFTKILRDPKGHLFG